MITHNFLKFNKNMGFTQVAGDCVFVCVCVRERESRCSRMSPESVVQPFKRGSVFADEIVLSAVSCLLSPQSVVLPVERGFFADEIVLSAVSCFEWPVGSFQQNCPALSLLVSPITWKLEPNSAVIGYNKEQTNCSF